MLEDVSSEKRSRVVCRLSRVSANDDDFFSELNMDAVSRGELLNLLYDRIPRDPIRELLDAPFRPRSGLRNKTRFSNGSFPVFYSALTMETAQAEVAYWFRKLYAGKPKGDRTAYYQSFRCTFEGLEKDLRSKVREWPDLVHDSDYSFCNRLGAEARERGVDGLIVPSARHEGANMPIFARRAVSDPKLEEVVGITYSPDSDEASIDRPPRE